MFDLISGVDSLTNFKRNTAEFTARMKENGRPIVLTVNGRAELVVQDAAAYQRLVELAERARTLEALREGFAAIQRGETLPAGDFLRELQGGKQ